MEQANKPGITEAIDIVDGVFDLMLSEIEKDSGNVAAIIHDSRQNLIHNLRYIERASRPEPEPEPQPNPPVTGISPRTLVSDTSAGGVRLPPSVNNAAISVDSFTRIRRRLEHIEHEPQLQHDRLIAGISQSASDSSAGGVRLPSSDNEAASSADSFTSSRRWLEHEPQLQPNASTTDTSPRPSASDDESGGVKLPSRISKASNSEGSFETILSSLEGIEHEPQPQPDPSTTGVSHQPSSSDNESGGVRLPPSIHTAGSPVDSSTSIRRWLEGIEPENPCTAASQRTSTSDGSTRGVRLPSSTNEGASTSDSSAGGVRLPVSEANPIARPVSSHDNPATSTRVSGGQSSTNTSTTLVNDIGESELGS